MIDQKYGLHIWTNGHFITKEGIIYHKIIFLTCPIIETKKRLMRQSGLNSHDGVIFQVSLTEEQILALEPQIQKIIQTLSLRP